MIGLLLEDWKEVAWLLAIASATVAISRPARSAIAKPSAAEAICTAPTILMISLYAVPAPIGPK